MDRESAGELDYYGGEGCMNLDYKEVYETLNDKQRKKLADTIDYALISKLPDCVTSFLAMQSVLENDEDLCLNRDQLVLFYDISKYIIKNREHIRELIYEAEKKEFFDSMDRLMAEQEMLGDNK